MKLGTDDIGKVYHGTDEVTKIYKGATEIWSSSDPIQTLVDQYKAYVASQGGTIGVSDAALYAEYEDMVTKGEIQSDGTNVKIQHNLGMYGYKLSGSDVIAVYGLVKKSGNYPIYGVASGFTYPLFDTDRFVFRNGASEAAIDLVQVSTSPSSGFYIEKNAKLIRATVDSIIFEMYSGTLVLTNLLRPSEAYRTRVFTPSDAVFTQSLVVNNDFNDYKISYNRDSFGNMVIRYFRNNVSTGSDGSLNFDFDGTTDKCLIRCSNSSCIYELRSYKIANL